MEANILSPAEWEVVYEYGKGYDDKRVAHNLNKSKWTTKTQKKSIYRKLGISKDTELVIFLFCVRMNKEFNLREIRKYGIEILFSFLFFYIQVGVINNRDMTRARTRTQSRTCRSNSRSGKLNDSLDLTGYF